MSYVAIVLDRDGNEVLRLGPREGEDAAQLLREGLRMDYPEPDYHIEVKEV